MKRDELSCNFSLQFRTNPLVKLDFRIYWSARNLEEITGSVSFFACREIPYRRKVSRKSKFWGLVEVNLK